MANLIFGSEGITDPDGYTNIISNELLSETWRINPNIAKPLPNLVPSIQVKLKSLWLREYIIFLLRQNKRNWTGSISGALLNNILPTLLYNWSDNFRHVLRKWNPNLTNVWIVWVDKKRKNYNLIRNCREGHWHNFLDFRLWRIV